MQIIGKVRSTKKNFTIKTSLKGDKGSMHPQTARLGASNTVVSHIQMDFKCDWPQ